MKPFYLTLAFANATLLMVVLSLADLFYIQMYFKAWCNSYFGLHSPVLIGDPFGPFVATMTVIGWWSLRGRWKSSMGTSSSAHASTNGKQVTKATAPTDLERDVNRHSVSRVGVWIGIVNAVVVLSLLSFF